MCELKGWIGSIPQMVYCEEYKNARRQFDNAHDDLEDAKENYKNAERVYDKIWDTHIPRSKDEMTEEFKQKR